MAFINSLTKQKNNSGYMRRVNLEKILFILHFHRLEFMTRQGYNVKKVSTKNTWHWGIYGFLLLGKSCLHLFGLH